MLRAGWFPLVVTDAGRADYIKVLKISDGAIYGCWWRMMQRGASANARKTSVVSTAGLCPWESVPILVTYFASPVYRFRFPGQIGGLIMPPSG